MRLNRILLLLLMAAFHQSALPQKQYHFRFGHLGTEAGLSQSNVLCIYQGSRGFMWFGTREGLNKYDGYTFTVYRADETNPNSLAHNTVQDIAEDADSNLWIATWGGGLDMFDRERGIFIHHRPDPNDPYSIGSLHINCLFRDSRGKLWIGTEGHGLQLYDRPTGRFLSFAHDDHDTGSI